MNKQYIFLHLLLFHGLLLILPDVGQADDPANWDKQNIPAQPSSLPTMALIESERIPDHSTLEEKEARIGNITIRRSNVFDPNKEEEDIFLFRLANSLHAVTRESIIENQLLFQSGDHYSHRLLTETERLLRTNGYLVDAEIKPVRYHEKDNVVDIEVFTQDAWTFTGSISFGREGGKNSFSAEVAESNLLGFGKDLQLRFDSNVDRNETQLRYVDPLLFGTRNRLTLVFADKSDGSTKFFSLERPFYSLDTRWAMGIAAGTDSQTDSLYEFGNIVNQFGHNEEIAEAYWGFSQGYVDNLVYRWRVGYQKQSDQFSPSNDFPGSPVPDDRDFRYPFVGFNLYEDKIIKTRRIRLIQRTEDLNLGNDIKVKLGWSDESFGATNEGLVFDAVANMAFKPAVDQLILFTPETSGNIDDGTAHNTTLAFTSRYYLPNIRNQIFYMALSAEYVKNPYLDNQVLLGGDSGLRGYPLRYQWGDRMFLLTLEQRFYSSWNLFELANMGGLVFFDVGRAWYPGVEKTERTDVLKDVGLGMRLTSTRSSGAVVLHIDLAFPLDGDESIDNMQLLISTHESF
ncbi:hypothetical protein [Kaarinaea lacus]